MVPHLYDRQAGPLQNFTVLRSQNSLSFSEYRRLAGQGWFVGLKWRKEWKLCMQSDLYWRLI